MLCRISFFVALTRAAVIITDPSAYADLAADGADDELTAEWDYTPTLYQLYDITGPYLYNGTDDTISHDVLQVSENDTSVVVITQDSNVNISYSTIIKHGYSSDIYQSSFYGLNAAINVANASVAYLDHVNVTVHNGAANIYAYGNDTTVSISDSNLYSSGPVSHGLYSAGYGTVIGRNIRHYSGGYRSSAFSGDSPAGYVYVYDSLAHTVGTGSAIFYGQGTVYAENIAGVAENAPVTFLDNAQVDIHHSDLTAGLLAGAVVFSSGARQSGSYVNLHNSKLSILPTASSALWFGNVVSSSYLENVEINTASGILVIANTSKVTQDFDSFADADSPAVATITVSESDLEGDIVAYNGSSISWTLTNHSTWRGAAYSGYGAANFSISLDETSRWTLTKDAAVSVFRGGDAALGNVDSGGFNLYYDSAALGNAWLKGRTAELNGGGVLKPATGQQLRRL